MTHELKTIEPYFSSIWDGEKRFEFRKNDRNFRVGDSVILKQYNPTNRKYLGGEILADISYVLTEFEGISQGYCILSLCNIINKSNNIIITP